MSDYIQWMVLFSLVMVEGTGAQMAGYLLGYELAYGKWWRGDLIVGHFPFGGWITDKQWYLNEVKIVGFFYLIYD